MTWILKEIPRHFMSQIDGSLVQIHTKFYDDSRFYFFYILKHDSCWENDGIAIGFGLIFEPTQTTVKMTWESPCHIFYRV